MRNILKHIVICLCLLGINYGLIGQNKTMDSLKVALKYAKHDTIRCEILGTIINNENDNKISLQYNNQLITLASQNSIREPNLKNVYLKYLAIANNNFGCIAQNNGQIENALLYFAKSLKINEEIGNKKETAICLGNIAYVYSTQGDKQKALQYYTESLKINENIRYKQGIANSLLGIGNIYSSKGEIEKALQFYSQHLKISEENNNMDEIALALNNIGVAYKNKNDYNKALEYFHKCLKIREEIDDKPGLATTLNNIGYIYFNQKKYNQALEYSLKSMRLNKEIGYPESTRNTAKQLNIIYTAIGNHKAALENYEIYITMRDSINNRQTQKASIKSQLNYEYGKKAAADSVKVSEEKKITVMQFKQEENQRYFLYAGIGLTGLFGLFMFNRFRITQKQKNIITEQKIIVETQKKLVDEKQKEILDSIHYAKRIQQSLLPNDKYLKKHIPKT